MNLRLKSNLTIKIRACKMQRGRSKNGRKKNLREKREREREHRAWLERINLKKESSWLERKKEEKIKS